MTQFGLDTSAVTSEPFEDDLIDDQLALIQACIRRLITPRGALWYDPNYGTDLRQFSSDVAPSGLIESAVISELLKEEAVTRVQAKALRDGETLRIQIQINASDANLRFTLALSATGAINTLVNQ